MVLHLRMHPKPRKMLVYEKYKENLVALRVYKSYMETCYLETCFSMENLAGTMDKT